MSDISDDMLDRLYTQLVHEEDWDPPFRGPTGEYELSQFCGPDGKFNDIPGLQAADREALTRSLTSLRTALEAASSPEITPG